MQVIQDKMSDAYTHEQPKLSRLTWPLLAMSVMFFWLAAFVAQRNDVTLTLDVDATSQGGFQIYFSSNGQFSEIRSQIWPLQTKLPQSVTMTVPTSEVGLLRFDPAPGMTQLRICNIHLHFPSGTSITIPSTQITPRNETDVMPAADGCELVTASASADDPQVQLSLKPWSAVLNQERQAGKMAGLAFVLLGLLSVFTFLLKTRRGRSALGLQLLLQKIEQSLPVIYILMALVFGTLFALVTPPGGVPDEPAHIAKVLLIHDGQLLGKKGGEVNVSLAEVLGPFQDFLSPERHFTVRQLLQHASHPLECKPSSEPMPLSATSYSPTLYIPQVVALATTCATKGSIGSFIYGGRLGSLLIAVLLGFSGLYFAGEGRWAIFVVALMPMTLFEQASMTADSIVFGMSFCLLGLQSGLASKKIMAGPKIELALFALGIGLAFSKPGYAWPCIGFMLCREAYRSVGRSFWPAACRTILVPWVIHIIWVLHSAPIVIPRVGVDTHLNLLRIFTKPMDFIGLIFNSFFGEGSSFLWTSLVGRLGWLDVVFQPVAYVIAGCCMAMAMLMRARQGVVVIRGFGWFAVLGISLTAMALVVLPMYLYWTPIGAVRVEGLQGRYFIIPVTFFILWAARSFPDNMRLIFSALICSGIFIVQCIALQGLVTSFYG